MSDRLWHGGVPDLRVGEVLTGGQERRSHDGCPYCEARALEAEGGERPALDPLALHRDRVYVTTDREYARFYASLYGYGDLYQVEPIGDLTPSAEDTMPAWSCEAATVTAVYARAVLLTWSQRRALHRRWKAADERAAS